MTTYQQNIIDKVYKKFVESDSIDIQWTDIDEQISILEWLDDRQLMIEAKVKLHEQSGGQPRCNQDHPINDCFIPIAIEAVKFIVDSYAKTKTLNSNDRFVIKYYLSLSQVGLIIY